jgi:hypothetical protein
VHRSGVRSTKRAGLFAPDIGFGADFLNHLGEQPSKLQKHPVHSQSLLQDFRHRSYTLADPPK